jgi:hypothetical protein
VLIVTDTPSAKIAVYLASLLDAKPEKCENVFSRVADEFEDDLLDFDSFPKEYFEFVLSLLGDEKLFSRAGVWNFLLALGTEKRKLIDEHYQLLAQVIAEHYPAYQNQDLCLAVCDFIARNYEAKWAAQLLARLQDLEALKPVDLRGFANDGLRILEREVSRSLHAKH